MLSGMQPHPSQRDLLGFEGRWIAVRFPGATWTFLYEFSTERQGVGVSRTCENARSGGR